VSQPVLFEGEVVVAVLGVLLHSGVVVACVLGGAGVLSVGAFSVASFVGMVMWRVFLCGRIVPVV
jgi:hypothetical protein